MTTVYEVVVERKTVNRFMVTARTQAEAAMEVGMKLGSATPWADSAEQEIDRKMLTPTKVAGGNEQTILDFDALRRGETPTDDEAASLDVPD